MNDKVFQSKRGLIAAALSMSLLSNAGMVISPALNALGRYYAGVPAHVVGMLITVPSLAMIPATLVSAPLQKLLGRRRLFLLCITAVLLAGLLPAFLHGFPFLFFCRILIGLAVGLYTPVNTSMLTSEFEGEQRSRVLGWNTAAESFGGAAMVLAGGWLAMLAWERCFYTYFLTLVPLLIAFLFLKEAPPQTAVSMQKPRSLPAAVYGVAVLMCVYMTFLNIFGTGASTLVVSKGLGGSFLTGILTAVYLLAGFLCGLVFETMDRFTRQYGFAFGIALSAIGLLLVALGTSTVVLTAGAVVGGFGMGYAFPAALSCISVITDPSFQTLAVSMVLSGSRVGMFLTTLVYLPLMTRAGFAIDMCYLVSGVVLLFLAGFCAFLFRKGRE